MPRDIKPMVVKLGGAALDGGVEPVLDAVVALSESSPVVLVHGGGKVVDELLGRLGMKSERIDGLRVTTAEQIDAVAGVLAGTVNKRLVGALIGRGARAVGVCLSEAGELPAAPLTHPDGDLGRVGRLVEGQPALLRLLLGGGYLPVVSSIGIGRGGELYNVNADDAAVALAGALGASALLLLTDVDGIRGGDGAVVEHADRAHVELLIEQGVISGGMIPKARGAAEAADRSGADVIIASWRSPRTLASLASGSPGGTRITPTGKDEPGAGTRGTDEHRKTTEAAR